MPSQFLVPALDGKNYLDLNVAAIASPFDKPYSSM